MSEALTRSLAGFVSDLRLSAVPANAWTVVHTGFADCIGTMIAGSIEDPPNILRKTLAPAPGDASLYLTGPRVPAPDAAWINGTAAHALDYDDVALRGHPSTVLVPAILAEESRSVQAGRSWQPPTSRATRCGPSWSAAIPRNTIRRAGIRPASSVPSARRQRVPLCAAWIQTGPHTQLRSAPRTALAW
jgi:hypothetical protein